VYVLVKYNQVTAVDTRQERFGGTVTITLTWQVTKMDVVEFVAAPDRDEWEPAFTPPAFEVTNPAAGDGAALITTKSSSITLVKKKQGYMAQQSVTFSGDFWEPFELENYPFDVQPLGVVLGTKTAMIDSIKFVVTSADLPKIRDTEWAAMGSAATCKFTLDDGKKKRGRYILTAEADTARYYSVHLYRVVAVMALFSFASIASLIDNLEMHPGDRLGIVFTLMLTATAYSLVIATGLPTLGYLTFLDKYILGTFGFISVVGAEVVGINWVTARYTDATEQEVADMMEYAAYINLGMWFIMHLTLFIYIKCKVIPSELKKIKTTKVKKTAKEVVVMGKDAITVDNPAFVDDEEN
jgi:hypothetical protein